MSDSNKPSVVPIRKDIKAYMVPTGRDEKHDVPVNFRITTQMARRVEVMMVDAKGKLPWKTSTDFYRWALWEGLKKASQEIGNPKLILLCKQYEAELDILREEELRDKILGLLDSIKKQVEHMERIGAWEEVPRFLRKAYGPLQGMEHENYWTRRVIKEFRKQYGDRMKERKVSLKPKDAERD